MGAGGGSLGQNTQNDLKDRFFANEAFSQMYNTRLEALRTQIFGANGLGIQTVERLSSVVETYIQKTGLIETKDYETAKQKFLSFFEDSEK